MEVAGSSSGHAGGDGFIGDAGSFRSEVGWFIEGRLHLAWMAQITEIEFIG